MGVGEILCGDCLEIMRQLPDDSIDLVLCSPPYENAREYGELGFSLKGQDWVDWAVERYLECDRICKGLVVWVVEGKTQMFRWSATPALLMADLHRAGVKMRKPPIYNRVGIPGSGGPDWWRNDYEFCVSSSKGRLPWSDPTATGKPPKYGPGGNMSHRTRKGGRVNDTKRYSPPTLANPGNVISCAVGGGRMGSDLAHGNEAPFPERLAEQFIKCFCPPSGIVLDPFCGSGTTLAVAVKNGRQFIGIDQRQSQVDLSLERVKEARGLMSPGGVNA
jgi:hypothetical protein